MCLLQSILKHWFLKDVASGSILKCGKKSVCLRTASAWYSSQNVGDRSSKFRFTDYDCIGFDLDNTLARYKIGNLMEMEYDIISRYLVKQGFSKEHLLKPLDHNFVIKGLVLDDENGNLLRLSPDGTIIQATHGTKWLNFDEISKYYPRRHWKATDLFTEDPIQTWNGPYSEKMRTLLDYFDTVASLAFARAVDSMDLRNPDQKPYDIWPYLLESLIYMFDRVHFQTDQGEYFREVKRHPEKYYYKCSNNLIEWLQILKKRGKRLFLVTGSHVDLATHVASNTLDPNWREFFDIVVCYAKKPGFFTTRRDFIGLNGFEETGPITYDDLKLGGMYTHGNWENLEKFMKSLSPAPDPRILFVGDNLIQDVYAPHVFANCDTVAVCEELEAERQPGFAEAYHPDQQFLCSTIWGSYFHCKVTNSVTNWYHLMKTHSKLCVPSLEYVAGFPVDHEFKLLS